MTIVAQPVHAEPAFGVRSLDHLALPQVLAKTGKFLGHGRTDQSVDCRLSSFGGTLCGARLAHHLIERRLRLLDLLRGRVVLQVVLVHRLGLFVAVLPRHRPRAALLLDKCAHVPFVVEVDKGFVVGLPRCGAAGACRAHLHLSHGELMKQPALCPPMSCGEWAQKAYARA